MSTNKISEISQSIQKALNSLDYRTRQELTIQLVEQLPSAINVETKKGKILIDGISSASLWRADTFLTKEPETIEWIDTFEINTRFWDIGANMGIYSLYAALNANIQVLAFEPAASNYYALNRNIELNQMAGQISALCIAFNDVSKFDFLYMGNTKVGASLHTFAENTNWKGERFIEKFKQGTIGFSIDKFVEIFSVAIPNYIKIDVDGIEDDIVYGAEKTLRDSNVKSLLIELNTDRVEYCQNVIDFLAQLGFKLVAKKHAPKYDTGRFSALYNCIFRR